MAKRVRVARSTHRPGGQGPARSKKSSGASTAPAEAVPETPSEVGFDAPPEGMDPVAAEYTEITLAQPAPAAGAATAGATTKRRRTGRRNKAKADDLASRMAAEDVWVRADLRRIGIVSVVLLVGLAVAWVLFYAMDLLNLY